MPTASSPADKKSPRAKSTGIDAKSVNVSSPGINDAIAKKSLKASNALPFVFPKSPDTLPHIKQSPAFWPLKTHFQKL